MPDVAIITAVYDGYDELKPVLPQKNADVEWIFVTDKVPDPAFTKGWEVVHEPRPGVHPNRAAKRPKFLPWEYTDAPISVWVDASFRITSETFVQDVIKFARPIAQFEHPWRDCLFKEADASLGLPKYAPDSEILEQKNAYFHWGHPPGWGLWATGVIARKHTEQVKAFGHAWLHETDTRTFQDQVSQPYVLRVSGLRPIGLPGTHFANRWLSYEGSGRH